MLLDNFFQRYLNKNKNIENKSYEIGDCSYSIAYFIAPGTIIGSYCSIAIGVKIGLDIYQTNFVSIWPGLNEHFYGKNFKKNRFPKIKIGHFRKKLTLWNINKFLEEVNVIKYA